MTFFFRHLFPVAALCAVLSFPLSAVRAADSAPKTDGSGWILPDLSSGSKTTDWSWYLRLNDARAEAVKDNKPILIVFSGPDWSSRSKSFESSILKSKEFASLVRPAVVGLYIQHFVKTTAPEEQVEANQSLRKALAVPQVYPCTVVLASDGKTILGIIQGVPGTTVRVDKMAYLRQVAQLIGVKIPE